MGHGHGHHGNGHEPHQPDPAEELRAARAAILDTDFAHAAIHLATAAAEIPEAVEFHETVANFCAAAEDPLAFVSLQGGGHVGQFVLRGMIEARCGRLTDALCHLLQAEAFDPGRPYLRALHGGALGDGPLAEVDADRVGEQLAKVTRGIDNLRDPARSAALDRTKQLFDRLLAVRPGSEPLTFAACILLRRMRKYDEAIELAEGFLKNQPSRRILIAIGSSARDKGDRERAMQAYEAAQALDPTEIGPSLDLGDMLGEDGRFAEAVERYAFALRGEPDNGWAQASLCYYRWLVSDDPGDLAELFRLAQDSNNRRAQRLHRLAAAYEHALSPRRDAILRALGGPETPLASASSSLEAPSAIAVALRLAPSLRISQGDAGGIDPRVPRRAVDTLLWRYGTKGFAEVATAEAKPEVTAAIRKIAAERYSAAAWFEKAGAVAAELGPGALPAAVAAMVVFDGLPLDDSPGDWMFDYQVAAAFVVAHLPGGPAALWDLVYGPVDWTSGAAVTALAQLAIAEPAQRQAIATELFAQIDSVENPVGYACLTMPAALNLLRIPEMPPEIRQLARAVRDRDLRS
jgi:tetratricopeptide (TPR) repeat protein